VNPNVSQVSVRRVYLIPIVRLANVLKRLVKKFVGEHAWFRLTQFKIEFKVINQQEFWDVELGKIFKATLPPNEFYVDVGAHDGRSSSNTYSLEAIRGNGVLVEPIFSKYFGIRQIRSFTSNKVFHAARVPTSYTKESVSMVYADLMSFSEELSTVDKKSWFVGARRFMNLKEHIVFAHSPARTLNSILVESEAPNHVDFLSIDVEGAEHSVLEGLDLSYYSFSLICIEAQNGSSISEIFEDPNYSLFAHVKNNDIFSYKVQVP
jgi:FkbM family methyltransferase